MVKCVICVDPRPTLETPPCKHIKKKRDEKKTNIIQNILTTIVQQEVASAQIMNQTSSTCTASPLVDYIYPGYRIATGYLTKSIRYTEMPDQISSAGTVWQINLFIPMNVYGCSIEKHAFRVSLLCSGVDCADAISVKSIVFRTGGDDNSCSICDFNIIFNICTQAVSKRLFTLEIYHEEKLVYHSKSFKVWARKTRKLVDYLSNLEWVKKRTSSGSMNETKTSVSNNIINDEDEEETDSSDIIDGGNEESLDEDTDKSDDDASRKKTEMTSCENVIPDSMDHVNDVSKIFKGCIVNAPKQGITTSEFDGWWTDAYQKRTMFKSTRSGGESVKDKSRRKSNESEIIEESLLDVTDNTLYRKMCEVETSLSKNGCIGFVDRCDIHWAGWCLMSAEFVESIVKTHFKGDKPPTNMALLEYNVKKL